MTAKTPSKDGTSTVPAEATAHVIVTPGGEGTVPGDDSGDTTRTQVMDRAEYAARLATGATPVGDTVFSDKPDATLAVIDPLPETSPAPGVVEVSASKADEADGTNAVQVSAPRTARAPAKPATRKR